MRPAIYIRHVSEDMSFTSSSMAAGCFSWCPCIPKQHNSGKTKGKEKDVETSASVVPSALEYATATGKETLMVLKSAAELIPVPFLKEAIDVALKVLDICEEVTAIDENVQILQDRISNLMIVVVNNVIPEDGTVSQAAFDKAAKEIQKDVSDLTRALRTITTDLNDIKSQNRLWLVCYRAPNQLKINECLDRLATALERFSVSNQVRQAEVLQSVQLRLQKIQDLTQHVANQVDHMHERLDRFNEILASINNANARGKSNVAMTRQKLPAKPHIFYGRDDLVEDISRLLCKEKNTSRVCILGPGGMGKTSLVLTIVHSPVVQDKYGSLQCFWVPCVEAASSIRFLELLAISLRIDPHVDDMLQAILSELNASDRPRLIVLDNFETPWHAKDDTQREVRNILLQLSQLSHVAILMTMRGAEPPCDRIEWQSKKLRPIGKDASLRIFHDLYPMSKSDPDVVRLLDAVGHMPFAVTLMSKLGKKVSSTANDLLKEWNHVGTEMISHSSSAEDDMNRSITLSLDHKFVRENPDALKLLAILSLLPAGTSRANLQWWAPNLKSTSTAIATLLDAALLTKSEGDSIESSSLFILPVVQSFMSSTGRISDQVRQQVQEACRQYIFQHAYRYYDPAFKKHSEALRAEDTNIQSILLGSESLSQRGPSIPSDQAVKALLGFSWYRFDTRPSIDVARRTLDLAELSGKETYIAEAMTILGGTCRILSKFEDAEQHLSKAYKLLDGLTMDGNVAMLAAECGLLLSQTKGFLQLEQSFPQLVSFIRELQSKYETHLDEFGRARIFKELGFHLAFGRQDEEALEILDRAKDMFTQLNHPSDVAETMVHMSLIYRWRSQLEKALEMLDGASNAIGSVDSHVHAVIHIYYGDVLISLGRYPEALEKLQLSLSSFNYVGSSLGVAQCLESIGYVYMNRGCYQDALAAYTATVEKYDEMGERFVMGQVSLQRCRTNLDRIKRKEENQEESISLIRFPC